jgi:hypothetical protein
MELVTHAEKGFDAVRLEFALMQPSSISPWSIPRALILWLAQKRSRSCRSPNKGCIYQRESRYAEEQSPAAVGGPCPRPIRSHIYKTELQGDCGKAQPRTHYHRGSDGAIRLDNIVKVPFPQETRHPLDKGLVQNCHGFPQSPA